MISPSQASALIRRHAPGAVAKKSRLADAFGLVLASDIRAPYPMPVADNSAMDGFVVRAHDVEGAEPNRPAVLKIIGTLKAGDAKSILLKAGTACRIMTGAFIPRGGEAVIPKEDAVVTGKYLFVKSSVRAGRHIRRRGEEIPKGGLLLRAGTPLNPAAIGVLASFGFAEVPVYPKPGVTVLATGSELVSPGSKLTPGKIYDSNSWMMRAALSQMGIVPLDVRTLRDEARRVREAVRAALLRSDFLILLGGVSVGDYDVVKDALRRAGVRTIFWKVSQKPGKPLFFGRKGKKLIFGLPGNPAAVFTCFYEYVYPALRRSMGHREPALARRRVRSAESVHPDGSKTLFLKARLSDKKSGGFSLAQVLGHQGSHMITSLADAHGFLRVPPGKGAAAKAGEFQMDLLPYKNHDGHSSSTF